MKKKNFFRDKFGSSLSKVKIPFRFLRMLSEGLLILISRQPNDGIHVYYGYRQLPTNNQISNGGIIKFQRLSKYFNNQSRKFNILYMVSSHYPPYARQLCQWVRRKGAKFAWNQDGIAYPAWMPSGWEEKNAEMAGFLHQADYVFYQSEYAKSCADHFLGKRNGRSEILYNAVDTEAFSPNGKKKKSNALTLLVIGSQYQTYRLESAIHALDIVRREQRGMRMIVAGRVTDRVMASVTHLIENLGLEEAVDFLPPFTQNSAVEVFNKGDLLLHTKVQDVCPGVVIEAMACGVPVVYSLSGGTQELVGADGGVGVPTSCSWEEYNPPKPELWAEAVLKVADDISAYREAARQRAVERFDIQPWLERHRLVFSELTDNLD